MLIKETRYFLKQTIIFINIAKTQNICGEKRIPQQYYFVCRFVYYSIYLLNCRNLSIINIYVNILEGDFTCYPYFECLFQTKCIKNFSTGYFFSPSKLYKTSLIYYLTFTDPLFFFSSITATIKKITHFLQLTTLIFLIGSSFVHIKKYV